MRINPVVTVFSAIALLISGYAAIAQETVRGPIGQTLDAMIEEHVTQEGFSGAILVEKDGEVILAKGYGMADREAKLPVTVDTVFTVGSITKQFTAAAILKLETQGKLSTKDKIGKYFDDVPRDKRKITLHHLLTHSSGIRDGFGDDFQPMSREKIVERAMKGTLKFEIGERYYYSNAGYSLLGAIVEIVSGQDYETFLSENLFKPAGMHDTGYLLPDWSEERLAIGYDVGYERWGTVTERAWDTDGPYWNLRANGGIHSTIGDMHKWYRALQGEDILSAEAKEKLFTPHVPEQRSGESHYGYGWAIFTTREGTKLIGHNGGNGIFYADFRMYVDEGVFIIEMTNNTDTYRGKLINALHRVPRGLPPEEL